MHSCNILKALSTQVQAISDLSHEVTGVRMYSFYKEDDEKRRKTRGPLSTAGSLLTSWQRCGKLGHGARRGYIRQAVAWRSCVTNSHWAIACSVGEQHSYAVTLRSEQEWVGHRRG